MNKDRRARIQDLVNRLECIKEELETIRDEEQDYYDNMPESIRGGMKGEKAEEDIENLEEAYAGIEQALDYLQEDY